MKTLSLSLLVFSIALFKAHSSQAQNDSLTNSTKPITNQNEISIGLSPALFFAIGARNTVYSSAWSLSYRRYNQNKTALRLGAEVYPFSPSNPFEGLVNLYTEVGGKTIFFYETVKRSPVTNVYVGYEKLFTKGKFTQGFAVDLGLFARKYTLSQNYFWNATTFYPGYYVLGQHVNPQYYANQKVDSLSYSYTSQTYGLSLKLLYTVRRELSKHFYLNASVGPIFWLGRSTYVATSGLRAPSKGDSWFYFDGDIFAADAGISYRF